MSLRQEIAVVGAGVGGLAVAALLRSLGHGVTVYDQAEAPVLDGPGLLLPPAALRVLERLGIEGAAKSYGVPIERIEGRDARSGASILDIGYSNKPGLGIQRSALVSLLYEEAKARGVDFQLGRLVLGAATTGHPYIRIEGGYQAGPFDYLVDAGGATSPLSPLVVKEKRFGAVWATVPLPPGDAELDGILRQRYDGAARMAGVLPLGKAPGEDFDQVGVYWSMEARRCMAWAEAGADAFKAEVASFWPDLGELVGTLNEDAFNWAPSFQGGLTLAAQKRVARIGDAAYQGVPMFSPGAGLALIDGMVLADCMATGEMKSVSMRYAAKRRLHTWAYQGLSRAMAPMFQSRFGWQGKMRDKVLAPALRAMPGLASRVLDGAILPVSFKRTEARLPVRPFVEHKIREPGE